jgi:DNA-binding MarR family transcriptional regulator
MRQNPLGQFPQLMISDKAKMPEQDTAAELLETIERIGNLANDIHSHWADSLEISAPQWLLLNAIKSLDPGRGVSVSEVARYLRVDPSFVTSQTKLLERAKLVKRLQSAVDGRIVLMSLTKRASDALTALKPRQTSLNRFIFSEFEESDLAALLGACRRIVKKLTKVPHKLAVGD